MNELREQRWDATVFIVSAFVYSESVAVLVSDGAAYKRLMVLPTNK